MTYLRLFATLQALSGLIILLLLTKAPILLPLSTNGFHKRYMCSNKAGRFWVNMVRPLDINLIVPQRGRAISGKAIPKFLTYIENLQCGLDISNPYYPYN